jgi:cellulose synthase/poly-beta-1,6-N-acetylglucosamine synthase-like glycosyltransferase
MSQYSQPQYSQYSQSQYTQSQYTQSQYSSHYDHATDVQSVISSQHVPPGKGHVVAGMMDNPLGASALPAYYQKVIGERMVIAQQEGEHDNPVGRVRSMERNPVSDVVNDRRGMLLIISTVLILNFGVFIVLFMRRLFPPPRDSVLRKFPLEAFALIAFVLVKMIVSWFYNPKPDTKVMVDGEPLLIFIPIYNEPEDILAKTLGALHNQTYSNRSITLMIVVDHDAGGLINVLNVVMADIGDGVENPVTGDLEYRGTFNDMAYLIVMKRHHSGKHGSEIILVRYLQKHPNDFKFLVTVDSDTILHPDAVSNIITAMDRDEHVIAACGKVMIANEKATLMTRLQAFVYTVNHIVDKHFQGFIDFITCLPGCFCVIRVEPLVNPEKDYWGIHLDKNHQLNYTREAITALDRNLLLMGEDRWRTNLLLFAREKGEKILYVPYAGADTFCPETLQQYIAQQRRWFISTIVNQVILMAQGKMWLKNPIGVFCELISIFGSLVMPVICLFLFSTILLIIWDRNNLGFISAMVVLAMLAFTCYLHGRFQHILYVWIYLPLAPVIMVYIPFYSFATFASDSWGTRGSRKEITTRQKQHLYIAYFVTFVLTILMLTIMFCSTVGTKCFF